jgi:hypothetical protein
MSSESACKENPLHASVEMGGPEPSSTPEKTITNERGKKTRNQQVNYLDISFNPDEKHETFDAIDDVWSSDVPIEETFKQNRFLGW